MVIDGGEVVKGVRADAEDWDGLGIAARVIKSEPERRFTLHVAYPANKPDVGIAADGWRDFAGPGAVEEAAWEFMKSGQQIGLWHADRTDGAGTLVESGIYRGPQWTMKAADGSTQTIEPGDWIIGIQWTPETWELVKSGRIQGVSMQGSAVRRKPSPEALASLRKESDDAEGGAA